MRSLLPGACCQGIRQTYSTDWKAIPDGTPPSLKINSTPADSNARWIASRLCTMGVRVPVSKSRTVESPTLARFASSGCGQPNQALAARHCSGEIMWTSYPDKLFRSRSCFYVAIGRTNRYNRPKHIMLMIRRWRSTSFSPRKPAPQPERHYADERRTGSRKFQAIRFSDNGGAAFCPRCQCTAIYTYAARRIWKCKACGHQFSVTSGTIFASRKLPIRDYLAAIAIFVNAVKGVSALQLGRDLDVQYKTAFVMAHKLREEEFMPPRRMALYPARSRSTAHITVVTLGKPTKRRTALTSGQMRKQPGVGNLW